MKPLLGYQWPLFYFIIGARELGKSYQVMEYCLSQWKNHGTPFTWIRLSTVSTQKLLANKANKLVDADLYRKYDLDLTTKGMDVFDHGKKMCKVLALTEMAKEKGVSLFDAQYNGYYNIVCDEFQREPTERNVFGPAGVGYALTGCLENLVRSRKHKVRIFLICNLLEEANEILADQFNFIPEEFGTYKLVKNKKTLMKMLAELENTTDADERFAIYKKYEKYDFGKRAVVQYLPPSGAYKVRRKGTVADILAGKTSNFTNEIAHDTSRIFKGNLTKAQYIIKFTKAKEDWFVVYNGCVICPYNNETLKRTVAMRPYIDEVFMPDLRNMVFSQYDAKGWYFRNIITQKKFEARLSQLKQTR
jgi:hypothetical protein